MTIRDSADLDRLLARRRRQVSLNLLHGARGPSGEAPASSNEPGHAAGPARALELRYEQFGLQPPGAIHLVPAPAPADRHAPEPEGAPG